LRGFSDKALKWQFSYTELHVFLVLPDLSQRHCSRPVPGLKPVGFLLAFLFSLFLLSAASRSSIWTLSCSSSIICPLMRWDQQTFPMVSAAEDLVDLLDTLAQALVCLLSGPSSVPC
jgi:hypothetical protein